MRYKLKKTYDQELQNEVELKAKENTLKFYKFINFVRNRIISLWDTSTDPVLTDTDPTKAEPNKYKIIPFDSQDETDIYYSDFVGETLDDLTIYEYGHP